MEDSGHQNMEDEESTRDWGDMDTVGDFQADRIIKDKERGSNMTATNIKARQGAADRRLMRSRKRSCINDMAPFSLTQGKEGHMRNSGC